MFEGNSRGMFLKVRTLLKVDIISSDWCSGYIRGLYEGKVVTVEEFDYLKDKIENTTKENFEDVWQVKSIEK